VRPAPTDAALADLIAEHYEAMLSSYGTEIGLRVARKHLDWYAEALPACRWTSPGAAPSSKAKAPPTSSPP
jgi:tRNA-dihydrouridine synthase